MKFHVAWNKFWFSPTSPATICLFRILLGLLALGDGLLWYPDFLTWCGNNAVITYESTHYFVDKLSFFSMHHFSDQEIYGLLDAYLIACVFVTVGFCSRTSVFFVWLLSVSLHHREVVFVHHVSIFVQLYAFTMIFAPAGAMYSVDAWIKKLHGRSVELKLYSPLAQRLLQFQVACVYWRASIGKLRGNTWLDGTAVYYALHYTIINRHLVPSFLDNLWFYKIMTYYTLVIELLMWTMVWISPFNKLVLLGAVFLHCGIEWFVNLDLLEWGIMIAYVLFLPSSDVEQFCLKTSRLISNLLWRPRSSSS